MRITVNGQGVELPAAANVAQALELLSVAAEHVVVEHNGDILEQEAFAAVRLENGDALEIVHFVGGG